MMTVADVREQGRDIWLDAAAIHYLQHGSYPEGSDDREKRRIRKRVLGYSWKHGKLTRIMADGSNRQVPPLEERAGIVRQYHGTGHLGSRRTAALVANSYYWRGMIMDIRLYVQQCDLCQRAKANFNAERPTLQPLPMVGLGYRWHCDLFGPIKHAKEGGNSYVMVCVESYSRWIEVIPIKSKEAKHTAQAFLHAVIARWGAPAEVVTDQGGEFEGEFDQLLMQCLVDHRRTSPSHPQANGAAERVVQTLKRSLQKLVEEHGSPRAWEQMLAWAVLAYRAAPQEASKLSPYELVYAKKPVIPPAVWDETCEPISLDIQESDISKLVADLFRRQQVYQRLAPMATENKAIAQHRDKQRYAQRRSGHYLPKLYDFRKGDLVYCEARTGDALQTKASPIILRIAEVRGSGVLILQGRDGKLKAVHSSQVAPCHLAGVDTTLDAELQLTTGEEPCQICHSPYDEAHMIMCDSCFTGWHMNCLTPALTAVPKGVWMCPRCDEQGLTHQQVQARKSAGQRQDNRLKQVRQNFPAAAAKRNEQRSAPLDGRLCQRLEQSAKGRPRWAYARLHYKGPSEKQQSLLLMTESGEHETLSFNELQDLQRRHVIRMLGPEETLPKKINIPSPSKKLLGSS
jgi:transposase InsO family protein